MTALPLRGVAVLVTRPAGQSAALARRLAEVGAEPVLLPTIGIEPLDDTTALDAAAAALAGFALVVFVSANAVANAMPRIAARGGFPPDVRVAAIGAGTAAALQAHHVTAVLTAPDGADSEALLDLPELATVAGQAVALFSGIGGRTLLRDELIARGARVAVVPCYRRVVPRTPVAPVVERLAAGRLQAVTVTSSEGLRNLQQMLPAPSLPALHRLPHVVVHPRIAAVARTLGVREVIECPGGDAAIVAALVARWQLRPVTSPP